MTEEQHFIGKVAQKAIIEKDGKILVCRGIGDAVWEFPGGRLHMGEVPQEGLAREIREELGVEITVREPVHVGRSYHGKAQMWQIIIGYRCDLPDDAEIVADPKEVEECKWISHEELKTLPMFDDCREIANVFLKH